MTGEYVAVKQTEHGTKYREACHLCSFGEEGIWTWFRDGAEVNASFHRYAHMDEGRLW